MNNSFPLTGGVKSAVAKFTWNISDRANIRWDKSKQDTVSLIN